MFATATMSSPDISHGTIHNSPEMVPSRRSTSKGLRAVSQDVKRAVSNTFVKSRRRTRKGIEDAVFVAKSFPKDVLPDEEKCRNSKSPAKFSF
jgi:hypothetical protein